MMEQRQVADRQADGEVDPASSATTANDGSTA
jgi:hypothetical protein